jgi:hypothetical protein
MPPGMMGYLKKLGILATVIFVPFRVYSLTHNLMYAAYSVALIAFLVICYLAFKRLYYINNFRRGYAESDSRAFLSFRKASIQIAADFSAHLSIVRTLHFRREPEAADLIDLYESMEDISFSELDYDSPDADFVRSRNNKKNILAVQWKPKRPISLYEPYRHEFRYTSPMLYGPDGFYNSIYCDKNVGSSEVRVESHHKIEWAAAFVLPLHKIEISEKLLYELAFLRKKKELADPKILSDGRHVMWKMKNPQVGKTYVLFCLYEGEKEKFKARFEPAKSETMIPRP